MAEDLITEARQLHRLLDTFERDVGRKATVRAFTMLGDLADTIERLTRERDEARAALKRANKALLFVDGYFSIGGTFNDEIDAVMVAARAALTAKEPHHG